MLRHQLHYKRARAKKAGTLANVRATRQALQRRLNKLISVGGFNAHGGAFGFFPAAGTNYAWATSRRSPPPEPMGRRCTCT